ncbi:MAG: cyclic nucleotide-binding domain-containing protein [Acidobacteriota bacterium]|nr:cyclic nucleotide-binding domain-containing protein [Acidobacteriota bacterium]
MLKVNKGEERSLFLLFTYSVGVGFFSSFYFPLANAAFLKTFEVADLPVAYVFSGLVGYICGSMISWAGSRRSARSVLLGNLIFQGVSLLVFVLFMKPGGDLVIYLMFVWAMPMLSLANMGFWLLAGRIYDLKQGKRLFPFIGAGDPIASLVGAALIGQLSAHWSPSRLYLLGGVGLLLCLASLTALVMLYHEPPAVPGKKLSDRKKDQPSVISSPYALLIIAAGVLYTLGNYYTDFSFLVGTRREFLDSPQSLAMFIAYFFGIAKVLELGLKLFLASWLVKQFGILPALLCYPFGVGVFAVVALTWGSIGGNDTVFFLAVLMAKFLAFLLRKSIYEPTSKILYQPMPAAERFALQAKMEGVFQQGAAVGAAFSLVLLTRNLSGETLLAVILALLCGAMSLWVAVSSMLFVQYRKMLIAVLREHSGSGLVTETAVTVREALCPMVVTHPELAFKLIFQIEPGRAADMMRGLLVDGDPKLRVPVLDWVEKVQPHGFIEALDKAFELESDMDRRERIVRIRKNLADRYARPPDQGFVMDLALSNDPGKRLEALGYMETNDETPYKEALAELLRDDVPAVRRRALLCAGHYRDRRFWYPLIDHLFTSTYHKAALAGLKLAGEEITEFIRRESRRFPPESYNLRKLIFFQEAAGDAPSIEALFHTAVTAGRDLAHLALLSLNHLGFQADSAEAERLSQCIRRRIFRYAWLQTALLDLEESAEAEELSAALTRQLETEMEDIFLTLGLICDPGSIRLIKNAMYENEEARAFALEIADLVIPFDLKPMVMPLIESDTPESLLFGLRDYHPWIRREPEARLRRIVIAGFDLVDNWIRVLALEALTEAGPENAPDEFAAALHSNTPILREAAAVGLQQLNPAALEDHLQQLPLGVVKQLDRVLGPKSKGHHMSLVEKVRALLSCNHFKNCSPEHLCDMAGDLMEVTRHLGDKVMQVGKPGHDAYLIVRGKLRIEIARVRYLGPGSLVGEIGALTGSTRTVTLVAEEKMLMLTIPREVIIEMLIQDPAMVPAMIKSIGRKLRNPPSGVRGNRNSRGSRAKARAGG